MRANFVAGILIVALGGWHAARPRPRASRDRRTHDGGLPTLLPAVTIAADTQGLEDGTPSSSEAGARRLLQTPACGLSLLLHKFAGVLPPPPTNLSVFSSMSCRICAPLGQSYISCVHIAADQPSTPCLRWVPCLPMLADQSPPVTSGLIGESAAVVRHSSRHARPDCKCRIAGFYHGASGIDLSTKQWIDASGANNHATLSGTTNATIVASCVNGVPCVKGNSTAKVTFPQASCWPML